MHFPCLTDIEKTFKSELYKKNYKFFQENKINPSLYFYLFPNGWGSNTLYTTVIIDDYSSYCGVFFNSKLAYIIKDPNEIFYEDLHKHKMKCASQSEIYKERR